MIAVQVTEWLPPASPCTEVLYECRYCGGYMPGCCERRDAHEVVLRSAWRGIVSFEEWCVLELMRLRDKGSEAWVQELGDEIAIFRERGEDEAI